MFSNDNIFRWRYFPTTTTVPTTMSPPCFLSNPSSTWLNSRTAAPYPTVYDVLTNQDNMGSALAKFPYRTSKSGLSFIINSNTTLCARLNIHDPTTLKRTPVPPKPPLTRATICLYPFLWKEYLACCNATNQCLRYLEDRYTDYMWSAKPQGTCYAPGFDSLLYRLSATLPPR